MTKLLMERFIDGAYGEFMLKVPEYSNAYVSLHYPDSTPYPSNIVGDDLIEIVQYE